MRNGKHRTSNNQHPMRKGNIERRTCSVENIEILKDVRTIRQRSVSFSAMKWGEGRGEVVLGDQGRSSETCFLQSTSNDERRRSFLPRAARQHDDTNGVKNLAQGRPSPRGLPWVQCRSTHHSRAERGERSEYIRLPGHRSRLRFLKMI